MLPLALSTASCAGDVGEPVEATEVIAGWGQRGVDAAGEPLVAIGSTAR
jgi:hypothetical protein